MTVISANAERASSKSELLLRNRGAWISLIVSCLVLLTKASAYFFTDSTAILSDALESIVNVLAAAVAMGVIRYVSRPAGPDHPYGKGKVEFFSSAFEGGLILFAACVIAVESTLALIRGSQPRSLDLGVGLMAVAGLINLALGLYLKWIGKKTNSAALAASGTHVLSDFWTSLGVLIGLGLMFITGANWIDPLIAILVTIQLGFSGYKIVSESFGALLDARDMDVLEELRQSLVKFRHSAIIEVHNLRAVRSGNFHHIDAHVVVPQFWDVLKAHDDTIAFEKKIVADYRFDGEIAFHVDPCEKLYCRNCSYEPCNIRIEKFVELKPITIESLIDNPNPD